MLDFHIGYLTGYAIGVVALGVSLVDKMKGWKTLAFAALVALGSFFASPEVTQWVAENLPTAGGTLAIIISALRWLTTSPIFQRPE